MKQLLLVLLSALTFRFSATAFEGRIQAVTTLGTETNGLLYTAGRTFLRVEMLATNWANPVDIVDLHTGGLTLLFPHNRSFVRLHPGAANQSITGPGTPAMRLPPGGFPQRISPQSAPESAAGLPALPVMPTIPQPPGGLPSGVGPPAQTGNGASGLPAMPMMPMPPMMSAMPGEQAELRPTSDKTNLLGFACERYELKQRGETLEIWATGQLFPYRPYLQNQPHRFGPRRFEDQWPEQLRAKDLFPLLVTLRHQGGAERFRFEVKSIIREDVGDPIGSLFQPPPGYHEIEPLPF